MHKDACMCTRAPSHTFILFPRPPPPPALSFPHLGRCELLVERHACKILSWPLPRLSRVPSLPFSFLSVSPTAGGTRNIHTGHIYIHIHTRTHTHTHTHTHAHIHVCMCMCVCVCVCTAGGTSRGICSQGGAQKLSRPRRDSAAESLGASPEPNLNPNAESLDPHTVFKASLRCCKSLGRCFLVCEGPWGGPKP